MPSSMWEHLFSLSFNFEYKKVSCVNPYTIMSVEQRFAFGINWRMLKVRIFGGFVVEDIKGEKAF